jgi:S-adenosylmethionine/arginine decarboxylase-like enzyme
MNHNQFWQKFMESDPLEIYDDAIEFFSEERPAHYMEDYEEIIFELSDDLEYYREYEKLVKFIELLQNNQSEIYKINFPYLADILVNYYLFKGNFTKAKESFQPFIDDPVRDYENYLILIKKLLFFEQYDVVKEAITENFEEILYSESLMMDGEDELVKIMFYIELDHYYSQNYLNRDEFEVKMNTLGFRFIEEQWQKLEPLFKDNENIQELKKLRTTKNKNELSTLEIQFYKYMRNKGLGIPVSAFIWNSLMYFLQINHPEETIQLHDFFDLEYKSFEEYLMKNMVDEVFGLVWGAVYLYDFLKSINFLTDDEHEEALFVIDKIKKDCKSFFKSDIWEYAFIHSWPKPDSVSIEEFTEEKFYFLDTFVTVPEPDFESRDDFFAWWDIDEEMFGEEMQDFDDEYYLPNEEQEKEDKFFYQGSSPIHVEKTPGRNDPCPCGSGKKYKNCCGRNK